MPIEQIPTANRTAMRSRAAKSAAAVAAAALVVSACSGGESNSAESTPTDSQEQSDSATQVSDGEQSSTTEELAFAEEDSDTDSSTSTDTSTDSEESDSGTPPTTAGSGLGPVTTVAGSGGDPDNIYIGVIGTLGLNQVVFEADVVAPTVAANAFPLTGLPANGTVPDRPAAAVKIDNGSRATPHRGLNSADIVIEEEVEGGVTRFAAIFHSTDSIVGPVRSGRTTDISLISSLGTPLLMYSGANDVTEGILREQDHIQNRNVGTSSGYWRDSSRQAPSNLFTDTAPHFASATGSAPPAQFAYRDAGSAVNGEPASGFTIAYPASESKWKWDGSSWLRSQRGSAHMLVSGEQVSAVNVVVVEAERVATGLVDSSGGVVPEFLYVGTGRAIVFVDGKRIDARWTRPTLASVSVLTDAEGDTVELSPGRTWVQLIEENSGFLKLDS